MPTAREIMTADVTFVRGDEPVREAATKLADAGVGALPICGVDDRLVGMLTDRDIVTKVIAAGKDPLAVRAGELAQGEAVTVGADDDVAELMRTMVAHKVRRAPVIDGTRVVGVISLADVARSLDDADTGMLTEALSTD